MKIKSSIKKLQKRLKRVGLSPTQAEIQARYGIYQKLARETEKANKQAKEITRLRAIIAKLLGKKNSAFAKMNRSTQRLNIDAALIPEKELKHAITFIGRLPTHKLGGKELKRYKKEVRRFMKLILQDVSPEELPKQGVSVGRATGDWTDKRLVAMGKLSWQDQMYYENFLLACVRVGNWWLYDYVFDNGFEVVKKLLAAGFEIREVYLTEWEAEQMNLERPSRMNTDEVMARYTSRLTITTDKLSPDSELWRNPHYFNEQNAEVMDILGLG